MGLFSKTSGPIRISRRQLIVGGAALVLGSSIINPVEAAVRSGARASERRLALSNLHTGEQVKTVYWQGGTYVRSALDEINHIMRDHRTNQIKQIDSNLLDLLHRLQGALDTHEPYQVVSGYRSPKTNARLAAHSGGVAKHSMHVEGKAIDIRLEGRDINQIHRAALALESGGVGYYPKSDFVHVDVGKVRFW
jgi:uncharacterized protein YcbK (DUF882 family)